MTLRPIGPHQDHQPDSSCPTRTRKMLPTSAASSIQKRRQYHRRQQSLEVPILATPLPPNPRRNHPGHRPGHRRGLSLDQSLSAINSPSGFRPLLPQDQHHHGRPPSGPPPPPSARTPLDTNLAFPPDQQHFIKQETQEHSLAQPGFPQQPPPQAQTTDFQSHLHQQLNGMFNPSVSAPNADQAAAMQSLQNHLMWYQQNFGNGEPNPNIQNPPFVQISHPVAGDMAAPVFMNQQQVPSTPIQQGHSHTVPNTPQNYVRSWPSPPPSHAKHQRSQSYQLDVAPMPHNNEAAHFASQPPVFRNGSFSMQGEPDYAASAYSASVADASSPAVQHSTPMPTLFEEPAPHFHQNGTMHVHDDMLLQAEAGAEPDFNSPSFIVGGVCPEQAALDAAGIDATYIETGVTEDQINSWLIHPTAKGEAYRCKWEGCDTAINRKENARSHVQNHLDDKRFRCNPCGKRFNRLHDTKRHHLTHTNERPAQCPCGKNFARADALTRHRQRDMCEGVLPGFEKTEAEKPKRGRPKKDRSKDDKRSHRPDMDARARKAAQARSMDKANNSSGSAQSFSSAASECSMPDTPPHDSDALSEADFLGMNNGNSQYNNAAHAWLDTPPTSPPSATSTKTVNAKNFHLGIPEELPEIVSPSKLSTRSSSTHKRGPTSVHESSSPADDANTLFADYSSPTYGGASGFNGESSPVDADEDIFNDAVNFDIMQSHPNVGHEVFSPPGESCSGSSVYNSDWDTVHIKSNIKATANVELPDVFDDSFMPVSRGAFGIDDFMSASEEDQYSQVRDILDSWVASH